MKQIVYAIVFTAIVGVLWFGSFGRSGGQETQFENARLDENFCIDADGNGGLDVTDAITILNYLFVGKGEPWCVAQDCSLEDLFVNEGQPDSITTEMIVDGSITEDKFSGGVRDRLENLETAGYVTSDELDAETAARIADVNAEQVRAEAAEAALESQLPKLGTWQSVAFNVTYTASTDGFVVAYLSTTSNNTFLRGGTGSSNPPPR